MPPTLRTFPSCNTTPIRSATWHPPRPPRSGVDRHLPDDPFPPEFVDQIVAERFRDRGRPDLQRFLRAFEGLLEFSHHPQDDGLVRPGLAAFGVHPDRPVVARDRLLVSFPRGESVGFPYIRIGHFFRIHGCPPPIPDGSSPEAIISGNSFIARMAPSHPRTDAKDPEPYPKVFSAIRAPPRDAARRAPRGFSAPHRPARFRGPSTLLRDAPSGLHR